MNQLSSKQANVLIGTSIGNAFISAKTNNSLAQIKALQAQNLAVQEEANQVIEEQNRLLAHQALDRANEKEKREVQLALKDLIFCLNEELDLIESTSSGLAESFFRSRSLSSTLDSEHLSSESFEEISDKTYWSNLNKRIKRIEEDALNSNDKNLKTFIPLVNAYLSLGDRPEEKEFSGRESILRKIEFRKRFLEEFFWKNGKASSGVFLPWHDSGLVPDELDLFAPGSLHFPHLSYQVYNSFLRLLMPLQALCFVIAAALIYFFWWEPMGEWFLAVILSLLILPIILSSYVKKVMDLNSPKDQHFDIIQKSIAASEKEIVEIDNQKKLLTEFRKNHNDLIKKISDFSDIYPFIKENGITTQEIL